MIGVRFKLYLKAPKSMRILLTILVAACLHRPVAVRSQVSMARDTLLANNASTALFESDEPLQIKLTGRINEVLTDRDENSKYHPFCFSYVKKDSNEETLPVRVKTRGHFRKDKANCTWPPLLINFTKKDVPPSSLFEGQDKLKLVMPCRGDEFVVREWLLYRLYSLITPKS